LTFLTTDSSRQLLTEGRESVRPVMRRWWDRAKVLPRIRHLQRMSADGGLILREWREPQ
jgi:hypothetical protein